MLRTTARIVLLSLLVTGVLFLAFPPIIYDAKASPASISSKPMHFYFHYIDIPVSVAGIQTHYIMNTTRWFKFPAQKEAYTNSFYKPVGLPKITVDFYLYPNLGGPVTIDGTWQVFIWVNGSAYKPCGFNVEFKEINVGGKTLWTSGALTPIVTSSIGGYIDVPIFAYNLSCTSLVHTFSSDATILAEVTINPGASAECRVWYDSPMYPSKVILPCQNYALPSSLKTFNANYTETNMFSVFWSESQRKVVVRTDVTDPFGGYDINMVNVTIFDPAKRPVLDNVKMSRISDGSWVFRYTHTYEASWSYPSTAMSGNYTVRVSVVDNNGYYRYLDYGTFEPYIEFNSSVFSIGLQYPIQFRTVDAHNEPMVNAQVFAVSRGVILASGFTDASGWWKTDLWAGYYDIIVYWRGTEVTKQLTEVREPSTFTIPCSVYYPAFKVVDDVNGPIFGAQVYIKSPNGTTSIQPFYTTETGFINLKQEPAGNYSFTVWWKGTIVQETSLVVNSDGPYTIKCQVYELTAKLSGVDEAPVPRAHVVVYDQTGLVYDFKITNESGQAVFKLPIGNYKFTVWWQGVVVQEITHRVNSSGPYTIPCQVYLLRINVLGNNGGPIQEAHVTIFSQDGMPYDFKITNASGVVMSRLPVGTYRIDVFYTTEYWLTHVAVSTTKPSVSVTSSREESITLTDYPPPLWKTIGFWLLIISVFVAVLAMVLILRKKGAIFKRKSG